jgi:hypothetical protein
MSMLKAENNIFYKLKMVQYTIEIESNQVAKTRKSLRYRSSKLKNASYHENFYVISVSMQHHCLQCYTLLDFF